MIRNHNYNKGFATLSNKNKMMMKTNGVTIYCDVIVCCTYFDIIHSDPSSETPAQVLNVPDTESSTEETTDIVATPEDTYLMIVLLI